MRDSSLSWVNHLIDDTEEAISYLLLVSPSIRWEIYLFQHILEDTLLAGIHIACVLASSYYYFVEYTLLWDIVLVVGKYIFFSYLCLINWKKLGVLSC